MKKISIKDVAQKAGVSIASVSYVLNNSPSNRISKDTVKKVKDAALELNYRPNRIAKSLKLRRTYTIGLLVADVANPYFSQIARLIEQEAKKIGYTILIGSCDENGERFGDLVDTLYDRQVDGFIVSPVEGSEKYLQQLIDQKAPFVMIDRYIPGLAASSIHMNNYEVSYQATEHFIRGNRKNILYVDIVTSLEHLLQREEGFKAALANHNIPFGKHQVLKLPTESSDYDIAAAFEQVFTNPTPPDAVLFSSNKLAIKGLKYLMQNAIQIPAKVAVIAFDESEAYDLFSVPVSYVRQPLAAMCFQAVETLESLITTPSFPVAQIVLNAELIRSASSQL